MRVLGLAVAVGVACAATWAQGNSGKLPPGLTGKYEVLDFRLSLNRILPETITVPEGRYMIRLLNPLTPDPVPLALDDERGQKVFEDRPNQGKARTSNLFDLKPGVVRLYVPGRAQWMVLITVTRK